MSDQAAARAPDTGEPVIQLIDVNKWYGEFQALKNVNLTVQRGERVVGAIDAVERELRRGKHMFRYAAADDFGVPETAFNICTFWYIDALASECSELQDCLSWKHCARCAKTPGAKTPCTSM